MEVQLAEELKKVIENKKSGDLRKFLKSHPETKLEERIDENLNTALHITCKLNFFSGLRYLLDHVSNSIFELGNV